jgi:hypothetical protein
MEDFLISTNMTKEIAILYQQIEDRYCKMAWNHTLQLKESDQREAKSKKLKLWKQILSAVSSAGIITILFTSFGWEMWLELATALVSVATMVITWLCDNGALDADVVKARSLAAECHNMRNMYDSLLADIKSGSIEIDEVRSRRSALEAAENELLKKEFLSVSPKAIQLAEEALKVKREAQTTEEERRTIIPIHLQLDN